MKLAAKSLLLLFALVATLAYAQTGPNTPIKHVIVVIQENRFGEVEPNYHYADHWAPDAFPSCPKSTCPYSLSDFFGNFSTNYDAEYFENFTGTPTDPDDDAIDPPSN